MRKSYLILLIILLTSCSWFDRDIKYNHRKIASYSFKSCIEKIREFIGAREISFEEINGALFGIPKEKSSREITTFHLEFDDMNKPIFLMGKNKKERYLSFSFDGELPWYQLYEYAKTDAKSMRLFKDFFGTRRYSKEELCKLLKVSKKQFDHFVIRKDTTKAELESWTLLDLSPKNFALAVSSLGGINSRTIRKFAKMTADLLNQRRIPVKAFEDVGFVEIAHKSSERIPKIFSDNIKYLEEHFSDATMHLHLGLPAEVINREEGQAIARAVEAKIILGYAERNFVGNLSYHEFSSLRKNTWDGKFGRGVIRYQPTEFKKPFKAHNLEIRYCPSDCMDFLKMATELSREHKALFVIRDFAPMEINDPHTSNLNGALMYIGILMQNNPNKTWNEVGQEMYKIGKRINDSGEITDLDRKEVRKFLKANNVLEVLENPALYINM